MHNASRHERGGSLHAGWQYWIQGLVRFRARPLPSWVFTRGARTLAIDLRMSSNHACQAEPGGVRGEEAIVTMLYIRHTVLVKGTDYRTVPGCKSVHTVTVR